MLTLLADCELNGHSPEHNAFFISLLAFFSLYLYLDIEKFECVRNHHLLSQHLIVISDIFQIIMPYLVSEEIADPTDPNP